MNYALHEENAGLPLGKLVGIIGLIFAVIAAGASLYGHFSLERKADAMQAAAKDQIRLEHLDTALASINSALSMTEKPEYLETKANILIDQNKVYEADQVLEKLIQLRPKNANYRYLSATMALNQDELSKGEQRLREAVQLEPDNATYSVYLGNMLYQEGKIDAARQQYEGIIGHDPKFKLAWEQYATSYINGERYPDAIGILNRALKQFPDDSDFYYLLGCAHDRQGDKAHAVAAYRHSLELEPMEDSIAASRIFELTGQHVPPALEKMTSGQVPFESEQNLMYVTATVNGHTGRFLLDTGASLCVLYQRATGKYNLTRSPYRTAVQTANGIIQVPIGYGDVNLGNRALSNVVFGVIPDSADAGTDGIIGMNFLGKFRMDIDKNAQTITLVRNHS